MPVAFDEYEVDGDDRNWWPAEGSNPRRVLTFLVEHPEMGFTPSEIAKAVDLPRGSVGPTLQRLHDRGLVRHKEPYWAIAEDDRIAAYEGMLHSLAAIEERYGDEGWADVDRSAYELDDDELDAWRASRRDEDE